MKITSKAFIFS